MKAEAGRSIYQCGAGSLPPPPGSDWRLFDDAEAGRVGLARPRDDLDLERMDAALTLTHRALFVKFEAPWCGHCKRLSPVWETMLGLDLDGARLGTVDCTRQDELRIRYGIRSYPTLMLFAEGQIKLFSGERSLPELSKFARGGWRKAPDHTLKPIGAASRGAVEISRVTG